MNRREAILGALATVVASAVPGVPVLLAAEAPLSPAALTISEMVARYWTKRLHRAFVLQMSGMGVLDSYEQAMIDFPTSGIGRSPAGFSPLGTWE